MNLGTCLFYTGLSMVGDHYRNGCCKAGVNYYETFDGKHAGIMLRMPCIEFRELPASGRGTHIKAGEPTIRQEIDRRGQAVIPCQLRVAPTEEQVQEDRRESDASFARVLTAIKGAAEWKVKPKPEQDRYVVIECPVCKGRLHLHQSSHNGHCSGKCETEGCASWME